MTSSGLNKTQSPSTSSQQINNKIKKGVERERERERETETERQRDRETERQRQRDRDTERQRETENMKITAMV